MDIGILLLTSLDNLVLTSGLHCSIKKKANTIRTGLKKMEVAIEQEEQNNPSAGAQLRMKKTQHMAVSKTFIEMMTEYNKIQTDFR